MDYDDPAFQVGDLRESLKFWVEWAGDPMRIRTAMTATHIRFIPYCFHCDTDYPDGGEAHTETCPYAVAKRLLAKGGR